MHVRFVLFKGGKTVLHLILFNYLQFHDNICIRAYTCANGLDVGLDYVKSIGTCTCIYLNVYVLMNLPSSTFD